MKELNKLKPTADLDELKILTEDKETRIKQTGIESKYIFTADNANEIKNKHNALVDYATGFPTEEQIQEITDTVSAKLPEDINNRITTNTNNITTNTNDITLLKNIVNKIVRLKRNGDTITLTLPSSLEGNEGSCLLTVVGVHNSKRISLTTTYWKWLSETSKPGLSFEETGENGLRVFLTSNDNINFTGSFLENGLTINIETFSGIIILN